SGSPVFNDDWELVALHHWGHPFLEQKDEKGKPLPQNVNEGVRVSALYNFLQGKLDSNTLPAAQKALLAEVLAPATTAGPPPRVLSPPRPASPGSESFIRPPSNGVTIMSDGTSNGEATLTIPLTISFRVGDAGVAVTAAQAGGGAVALVGKPLASAASAA